MNSNSKQSSPLAIFLGDTHLDLGAWANRPLITGDSLEAFKYVCGYARRHGIPYIFGAGDLIDVKKPPPEIVQFVREQLDLLEEHSCEFYFIQGQHEYSPDLPWFCAIHDWPQWLNQRYVTIADKCNVYGLDWRSADAIPDAFDNIPHDTDILLMHQVWLEFMGDKCGCECSFATVPHASVVFTGDYHNNQSRIIDRLNGQKLKVISPGSTNMRKIDEPVDKYFYVLFDDFVWKRVRIPTRRKFEIRMETEHDVTHFDKHYDVAFSEARADARQLKLPANLARPLCRVIYNDELDGAYKTIKSVVDSKDVELFLKPLPPKSPETIEIDRQTFSQSSARGLTGMLETAVGKDSVSYKILSRLLTCPDSKQELQTMRKERGLV
jgi:hypothetical protein